MLHELYLSWGLYLNWGFKADPQSTAECNERQKIKETEAFF